VVIATSFWTASVMVEEVPIWVVAETADDDKALSKLPFTVETL
jgi:hypothetical protein